MSDLILIGQQVLKYLDGDHVAKREGKGEGKGKETFKTLQGTEEAWQTCDKTVGAPATNERSR
jgi:hypothetical protein